MLGSHSTRILVVDCSVDIGGRKGNHAPLQRFLGCQSPLGAKEGGMSRREGAERYLREGHPSF
jgi:hypothetical protein